MSECDRCCSWCYWYESAVELDEQEKKHSANGSGVSSVQKPSAKEKKSDGVQADTPDSEGEPQKVEVAYDIGSRVRATRDIRDGTEIAVEVGTCGHVIGFRNQDAAWHCRVDVAWDFRVDGKRASILVHPSRIELEAFGKGSRVQYHSKRSDWETAVVDAYENGFFNLQICHVSPCEDGISKRVDVTCHIKERVEASRVRKPEALVEAEIVETARDFVTVEVIGEESVTVPKSTKGVVKAIDQDGNAHIDFVGIASYKPVAKSNFMWLPPLREAAWYTRSGWLEGNVHTEKLTIREAKRKLTQGKCTSEILSGTRQTHADKKVDITFGSGKLVSKQETLQFRDFITYLKPTETSEAET